MAEFPYFNFYAGDYLADTKHLTTIEHGAYLLLLITAWRCRGCVLPDDDAKLARYVGVTHRQWVRIRPVMLEFWTIEDGGWSNARLSKEYDAVRRQRVQSSNAGKASALKRQKTTPTGVDPFVQRDGNQPEPEPESKKEEENTPPPPSEDAAKAEGGGGRVVQLEDEIVNLIVADYDNAIEEVFGAQLRRPWPGETDRVTAKRWVEAGVTPVIAADVFRRNLHRARAKGNEPFNSLSYFNAAVSRVVQAAREGKIGAPKLRESPEDAAAARKRTDTLLRKMILAGDHPQYDESDIPMLEAEGTLLRTTACNEDIAKRKQKA